MEDSVGYLGPKGTFTNIAVEALFRGALQMPYSTIPDCFDAVKFGHVKYVVVPLENTIEGSVNLTIDYLISSKSLKIVSEIIVPIKQHFMVHQDHVDDWKKISTVVSHPHALAQCHKFLTYSMRTTVKEPMSSTGEAAKYVSEHKDEMIAAIANRAAAKTYDLAIVKENIHDIENNHTRFVVLHKNDTSLRCKTIKRKGFKTTLMISLPVDQPGGLHRVLSAFSWRNLNLSKIESRPMKTKLGQYYFLIDIEKKMDTILLPNTILELEAIGCQVEILGSYPYYIVDELV